MDVHRILSGPFEVNAWLIVDAREALVVDATTGADFDARVAPALARLIDPARVKFLHLTHLHCDHVGGAARMRALTGCRVCMHADEADVVREGDARRTLGEFAGLRQEPCPVEGVREGHKLDVGNATFEVLEVPGHTEHHTALYDAASGSLFGGDLIFPGGSFGRVDFPGGDGRALVASLRRVAGLDLRNLYAGHMAPVVGGAGAAVKESLENAQAMLDEGML